MLIPIKFTTCAVDTDRGGSGRVSTKGTGRADTPGHGADAYLPGLGGGAALMAARPRAAAGSAWSGPAACTGGACRSSGVYRAVGGGVFTINDGHAGGATSAPPLDFSTFWPRQPARP